MTRCLVPIASRPAVFLDRDGTLIEEVNYLADPDRVQLIPGTAAAVRRLNHLNIPVVVVTNQAGVARGYFPESQVTEIHARIDLLLCEQGARIDRYFVCTHHPTAGIGAYLVDCDCRKPNPGLLRSAARELGLRLSGSCMIGDKQSDLEAGVRAGCQPILVRTGYGAGIDLGMLPADWGVLAATSLADAVDRWLDLGNLLNPG